MARPNGDRAGVDGGAGEEKEEKSSSSCHSGFHLFRHSFSTAFSLAIMALSSSSNGGAAPKVRSVERSNGGFNSHESRLLQGGAFFLIEIGIGRARERQSKYLLAKTGR